MDVWYDTEIGGMGVVGNYRAHRGHGGEAGDLQRRRPQTKKCGLTLQRILCLSVLSVPSVVKNNCIVPAAGQSFVNSVSSVRGFIVLNSVLAAR